MLGFINFLIEKGFTPYRKAGDKYVKCSLLEYYSSAMPSYIDLRLVKDELEIAYGLHEYKHPPTLISPRPKGVVFDYEMDRLFESKSYEEIYSMILKGG